MAIYQRIASHEVQGGGMNINKYGIIKGGLCEQRLTERRMRSLGSRMAWDDINEDRRFVRFSNGWYKIVKIPDGRGMGNYGKGIIEIGYLRMLQIVFPSLINSGKKFRLKWMDKWIEGIASCEFGIFSETPLSIITPGEKFSFGMMPPKPGDDDIYEKIHGVPRGLVS